MAVSDMTTTLHTTHIAVLDDDPTPIVTPVIDHLIPCQGVIIIHRASQRTRFRAAQNVLQARGFPTEGFEIADSDSLDSIQMQLMTLLEQAKGNRELWFNASGHHQALLLCALYVFGLEQIPTFFIDRITDQLHWLSPASKPTQAVQDKLTLAEYFKLRDLQYEAKSTLVDKRLFGLATTWSEKATRITVSIARLNYLANVAEQNALSANMDEAMLRDTGLQWLLDSLNTLQYCHISGRKVSFADEAARFFAGGGWLEVLTHGHIQQLKSQITEIRGCAASAVLSRSNVKNEIDTVALVNNKLHLLECKTRQFKQGQSASNTLYKLSALRKRLGTPHTRLALVTYHRLSKAEMLRAQESQIQIFQHGQLANLGQHLALWLQSA